MTIGVMMIMGAGAARIDPMVALRYE